MDAIYRCSFKGVVAEVAVPMKSGVTKIRQGEERLGEYYAARRFKKQHEFHPCIKVRVEFVRYAA